MSAVRSFAFATLTAVVAGTAALPAAPVQAQAQAVDMERFDGRWYEIARTPNRYQRSCNRLSIDWTPQAQGGRYSVLNTCIRAADGKTETLRANARLTDAASNAKFRMSLTGLLSVGGLASQNYWVWDRAPDYSWAIMGLPDKSHFWVWSRSAAPSAETRASVLARARTLGFNTAQVVHTGR